MDKIMVGDTFEKQGKPGEAWEVTEVSAEVVRLDCHHSWSFVMRADLENGLRWRRVHAREVLVGRTTEADVKPCSSGGPASVGRGTEVAR